MCWRGQHSPAHRDTEVAAGFKGLLGVDLASEEHLVDEHLHKIEQRLLHLGARGHTRGPVCSSRSASKNSSRRSEPGKFDGFPGKIERKREGAVEKKGKKTDGVREANLLLANRAPLQSRNRARSLLSGPTKRGLRAWWRASPAAEEKNHPLDCKLSMTTFPPASKPWARRTTLPESSAPVARLRG